MKLNEQTENRMGHPCSTTFHGTPELLTEEMRISLQNLFVKINNIVSVVLENEYKL